MSSPPDTLRYNRTFLILACAFVVALLLAGWQIGRLRPPSALRFATGPQGEHEYNYALLLQEYLADVGVTLEIVPTAGSLEILTLIQQGEVDAGFFLNAANQHVDSTGVVTLGGIQHVPIWVLYRQELAADAPLEDFGDLQDLRVSAGEADSGTRALLSLLLQIGQIPEDDLTIIDLAPAVAAERLLNGELDVMIMAANINSDSLLRVLTAPDIDLMNIKRAATYARLIPFLDVVMLPEGALNMAANYPSQDTNMLADSTLLIADKALHPDLQLLLLRAAKARQDDLFDLFPRDDEDYPTTADLTLPMSETAVRFIHESPTPLERYLPYWIASPMERFYLLALPFLLIIYPLIRNTPVAYAAMMRRRVYRWYGRVREIELHLPEYSVAEIDEHIATLEALQQQLTETINVPTSYLHTFYSLRVHLRLVIERLIQQREILLSSSSAKPDADLHETPTTAPSRSSS